MPNSRHISQAWRSASSQWQACLLFFRESTQHHRLERTMCLPPNKNPAKEQERYREGIETNTFPDPTRAHTLAPTPRHAASARLQAPSTIICGDRGFRKYALSPSLPEHWDRELPNPHRHNQLWMVKRPKNPDGLN